MTENQERKARLNAMDSYADRRLNRDKEKAEDEREWQELEAQRIKAQRTIDADMGLTDE
jgi:hypothetical protein